MKSILDWLNSEEPPAHPNARCALPSEGSAHEPIVSLDISTDGHNVTIFKNGRVAIFIAGDPLTPLQVSKDAETVIVAFARACSELMHDNALLKHEAEKLKKHLNPALKVLLGISGKTDE